MPTNRKKRARVASLDEWKREQLATGEFLIAGVGYASAVARGLNHWTAEDMATVRDAMRADWAIHGASMLRDLTGDAQPWAATEFGAPL